MGFLFSWDALYKTIVITIIIPPPPPPILAFTFFLPYLERRVLS